MKFLIKYKEFDRDYETIVYASSEESAIKILMDDLGYITLLSIRSCQE